MRYSDAAEKYYNETKKRIFDNVIAAAENGDDRPNSNTEDIIQKKEHITMSRTTDTTERQDIKKNSKGAIAAAACAVMILGGGTAALSKLNADSDKPVPSSESLTAAQQIVVEDPADSQSETAASENVPVTNGFADDYDVIVDAEYIQTGVFFKRGDEYFPITEYTGGENDGFYAEYKFDLAGACFKGTNLLNRNDTFTEYLEISVDADELLNMSDEQKRELKGNAAPEGKYLLCVDYKDNGDVPTTVRIQFVDTPDVKGYGFISSEEESMGEAVLLEDVNDYVFDSFKGKELLDFCEWAVYHGVEYTARDEYSDTVEKDKIIDVEWSAEKSAFVAVISKGKSEEGAGQEEETRSSADEESQEGSDVTITTEMGQIVKELKVYDKGSITEGFDGYAIEIGNIYVTDLNNIMVRIKVTKRGAAAEYDPAAGLDVIYNDLEPIMSLMGAEEVYLSWFSGDDNSALANGDLVYYYTLSSIGGLDLDKIDGTASVPFGINTITEDGDVKGSGNFEAQIRLDMSTAR